MPLLDSALVAHAVAAAISSGMMLVFSNSILPAFDRLPAGDAIAAMNSINVAVINPLFLGLFLGTGLTAAALAGWQVSQRGAAASGWTLLAAGVYLVGVVFVTVGGNVPLNDALAAVTAEGASAQAWLDYTRPWIRWNNVRAVASAASSAAFVLAAVGTGRLREFARTTKPPLDDSSRGFVVAGQVRRYSNFLASMSRATWWEKMGSLLPCRHRRRLP